MRAESPLAKPDCKRGLPCPAVADSNKFGDKRDFHSEEAIEGPGAKESSRLAIRPAFEGSGNIGPWTTSSEVER